MLVDALRQIYVLPELLAVLSLARSSYFYHRARLLVADKYAGVRCSSQTSSSSITVAMAIVEYAQRWAGIRYPYWRKAHGV
jgi:hypothetical protein